MCVHKYISDHQDQNENHYQGIIWIPLKGKFMWKDIFVMLAMIWIHCSWSLAKSTWFLQDAFLDEPEEVGHVTDAC